MCSSVIIDDRRGTALRTLVAACACCFMLVACTDDDSTGLVEPPPTSTNQQMDAGRAERPRVRPDANVEVEDDAGEEAAWRDAAAELAGVGPGLHVILADEPPTKATEVFLFQVALVALQGNFADGSKVTVYFDDAVGTYDCSRGGAHVQYEDARGTWKADSARGDCSVQLTSFETTSGAPVTGSFDAELLRTGGEDAEALRLAGRFDVGYP